MSQTTRTVLVLGLLSAVGPFAIDMYLPALPQIAEGLNASVAEVQLTLTLFFLAFGVAQLVYGPMADALGRRLPIVIGMGVFIAGSIGCALSPNVEMLSAFRVLQGLGAAAVMVVPRAVIRDMHTGPEATRMMATVMLVISVSPMLAPLTGSGMMAIGSWRLIFWALIIAGGLGLILTLVALPETLPRAARQPVRLGPLMQGARILLTDRIFLGLTLVGGFGMASFFVFIASASFVYTGQYGLGPTGFSLAFAVNALGFFGASQLAGPIGMRTGMARMMLWAVAGFAACTMALAVVFALGGGSLALLMAGLFLANAFLGLVIPASMVTALDAHGDIAGLASSLGGTLQMLTGGVMIAVTGLFFDGTALPMVAAIALCGLAALVMAGLTLPRLAARPVAG